MRIVRSIGWIVLVQAGIIGLIFGLIYVLKAAGISGGYVTQVLPFLVILTVTTILMKIRKRSLSDIGFTFSRGGVLLAVLFLAVAMAPFFAGPVSVRTEDPLPWNIGYFCLVGFAEEFFFRGYIKTEFGEGKPLDMACRFRARVRLASFHLFRGTDRDALRPSRTVRRGLRSSSGPSRIHCSSD